MNDQCASSTLLNELRRKDIGILVNIELLEQCIEIHEELKLVFEMVEEDQFLSNRRFKMSYFNLHNKHQSNLHNQMEEILTNKNIKMEEIEQFIREEISYKLDQIKFLQNNQTLSIDNESGIDINSSPSPSQSPSSSSSASPHAKRFRQMIERNRDKSNAKLLRTRKLWRM
ncbi:hypothetical protein SNEBB_011132 [Seison nebaliae]|nr:hypothetical protein SNEBB_011132 [Seison nebaliae]